MTLHPCLNCATIFACDDHHQLRCPSCGGSLELREQAGEKTVTFAELAIMAVHGEAPKAKSAWRIG